MKTQMPFLGLPLLLPLLVAIIIAFSFQGSRSLFGTSEGRYAECGREMAESGNYLEPTLEYRPHWSKPPLTYWGIAAGLKLLGNNEWGARLFNALAFIFTVMAVTGIGRLLYDPRTGQLAGLIYATSLLPVIGAFTITTDMLLTMWVTLAVLAFMKARRAAELHANTARWIIWFWVALGLGFFTKGPPALLILLPIIAFNLSSPRPRPRLLNPVGIVLFLALSLWWFLTVCTLHPELWHYYLGTEVVGRVASSHVHNHALYKAFEIYPAALTGGLGIWLLPAIYLAWRLKLYRPSRTKAFIKDSLPARFLFLWLVLPLVVFTVSSSKLQLYLLPIFAPLCIATAAAVFRCGPLTSRLRRAVAISLVAAFALVFSMKMLAPYKETKRNMREVYQMCLKYKTPRTRFFLADHPSYDLVFYLQGDIAHLGDYRLGKNDEGLTPEVIRDIQSGQLHDLPLPRKYAVSGKSLPKPDRIVFIHPLWKRPGQDNNLQALRAMATSISSNKYWMVIAVDIKQD